MRNKAHQQIALAVTARVAQTDPKQWKEWIRDMENTTKVEGEKAGADTSGQQQFMAAVKMGQI